MVSRDRPCSIGRLKESDLCLLHENVSRQHAQVMYRAGVWFVVDLDSKWGTYLNGVRLTKHKPAALAGGDLLRIGPWTFRIQGLANPTSGVLTARHTTTLDDRTVSGQRIERVSTQNSAWRADKRLRLILECMSRLADEIDEAQLAATALELLINGSGYSRGTVLRRVDEAAEIEIVASFPVDEPFDLSRSLLREASTGVPAFLTGAPSFVPSQSMSEMRIHSAMCVPVTIGGTVIGFLYLDARGKETQVQADAAAFCEAVGAAYSLALANIKRLELEQRERLLSKELEGARAVQELLTPHLEANIGAISYAARTRPGLFVAGDLFDVMRVPGGNIAVVIGDVSGRGAAAGMHMAIVQSYLHAELSRGVDPAEAIIAVNRYLHARIAVGRFVSIWVGVFDSSGAIRYVDAGHGHWLIFSKTVGVRHAVDEPWEGGIPIGIDPEFGYKTGIMQLLCGEKLVLYSDGMVEQRNSKGEQFRRQRLGEVFGAEQTPQAAVELSYQTVSTFAGREELDDDATIAVIEIRPKAD